MPFLKVVCCLFVYTCLILIIPSCQRNDADVSDILATLEQVVEQNPDSILSVLDSIIDPYDLDEKNLNKFYLLQIQAKDKTYRDITSDTVIFQVRDYYMYKNDVENTALASFYCGRVLQEQNEDKRAIKEYLKAEEYADRTRGNRLKGLIQSAIGSIFLKQFMETEAIKYFCKAVQYFSIANNTKNEIITYNQIGNAYLMKSFNDSSLHYYEKGLSLAKISNDSLQMANITQCIGIAYRQIGNFNLAIEYFKMAEKYTTNNNYKVKLYLNLSKTFYEKELQDSAKYYIDKTLSTIRIEEIDLNLQASIYGTLSDISEKRGDFKQSLDFYKIYTETIEQIVDENKNTEILELQKKYKYELFQNENNRLKIQEQRLLLIFLIIVVILVVIVTFLYKKFLDNKKNAIEKNNKIIDAEKKIYQLIEMSNSVNNMDDSLKGILFHHFDILKKVALLKQYLKNEDEQDLRLVKKVHEIVYGQESLNWDMLYQDMNKMYDGLFERLSLKQPLLDKTEFRVCCLTYANLSCSEIGIILDLSPNTVQMKRSSIRKKLGIESQGNIQAYIDSEI